MPRRYADLKRELLEDPEFRAGYEALKPEFALVRAVIRARTNAGLTQAALAERMGTTQSVVARIESGRRMPNMATILKIAEATGTMPVIDFVPKPDKRSGRRAA